MKTLWKGAVSFGLVNIPVNMYVATENKDLKFHYLHEACMAPVNYKKVCSKCDKEVRPEEIVKGYEFQKGSYIIISEDDLARIPQENTKTIDILDFVRLEQVDPIYFEKSYYLEPSPGGDKAYTLIVEAMKKTGRIAIAKIVIRSKQSLAALRVKDGRLLMETIFYPDEIRSPASLKGGVDTDKLNEKELQMAVDLIENLSVDFNPDQYKDEYRQALWEMIEAKIAGQDFVSPAPEPQGGKVVDLMEALKASVQMTEAQKSKNPASGKKTGSRKRAGAGV
jgi:DNA end-binding protein Ku